MNAQLRPQEPRIGIFTDEPANVYHQRRLDEASASGLKQILRCPAYFKHWVENPDNDKTSPALAFGSALHCAVLEPEVFARKYIVLPADAPNYPTRRQWDAKKPSIDSIRAMDWWRDFEAANAGRVKLSADDYEKVRRMADSALSDPVARGLLMGGDRETSLRWVDEETGIACKARCDLYVPGELMMDLKSCRDASKDGFGRAIDTYGYDLQGAHYVESVRATGGSIKFFLFLAIESEAPYVAQVHKLGPRTEAAGWALRQKAIKQQAECLKTGRWPGYADSVIETDKPEWSFRKTEEFAA